MSGIGMTAVTRWRDGRAFLILIADDGREAVHEITIGGLHRLIESAVTTLRLAADRPGERIGEG